MSKSLNDPAAINLCALRSIYESLEQTSGPKKQRLYQACLKMVEQGFWNPGDRLPTDIDLCENLPVSLGTVQIVFRRLKDECLIKRNKRGGSYLSNADQINRDYRFFAYLDDDGESVIPLKSEYFSIALVDERGSWSDFLNDSRQYLRITRVISVRDEFKLLSDFYLASSPFESLMSIPQQEICNASIKNLLQIRFNLPTLATEWRMRSLVIDDGWAKTLCEDAGTLGTQFDVYGYTLHEAPLFFHRFIAPCNKRVMKIVT